MPGLESKVTWPMKSGRCDLLLGKQGWTDNGPDVTVILDFAGKALMYPSNYNNQGITENMSTDMN